MITATGWQIACEHKGCEATLTGTTRHLLVDNANGKGWQIGVRRDGTLAVRNGKDYCPEHHRPAGTGGAGEAPGLAHLVELLDSPDPEWRPTGSGEWAVARTAHIRGLLDMHMSDAGQTFSLTDAGRAAAVDAKIRRVKRRRRDRTER